MNHDEGVRIAFACREARIGRTFVQPCTSSRHPPPTDRRRRSSFLRPWSQQQLLPDVLPQRRFRAWLATSKQCETEIRPSMQWSFPRVFFFEGRVFFSEGSVAFVIVASLSTTSRADFCQMRNRRCGNATLHLLTREAAPQSKAAMASRSSHSFPLETLALA